MYLWIDDKTGWLSLTGYDRVELCKIIGISERALCKRLGKSKSYLQYYRRYYTQPQEVIWCLLELLKEKESI